MTKLRWSKVDRGLSSLDYMTPLPWPVNEDGYRGAYGGTVATHVKRWYNREERSWVVSLSTADGEQVGSSEYVYSRDDAEHETEFFISSVRSGHYPKPD